MLLGTLNAILKLYFSKICNLHKHSKTTFSFVLLTYAAHKLPTSSNTDHNSIVLRKLNAIIRKLELVDGRLHSLTIKNLGMEDNAEFEETEGFLPISDDEGLMNFEHRLKHETGFRTKMISVLRSIGGQSLVSVTSGIMRRIWTNSLASTYSMLGRKQKKIFRNLSTYKLVIDTVRVHRPNATEDQIQEVIAKWLVHAPVRHIRTKPKEDASPASTAI